MDTIAYEKVPFPKDAVLGDGQEQFLELVRKAKLQAIREGIKANTIAINSNMVKVLSSPFVDGFGGYYVLPTMICGMNAVLTKDELPENYSFAIFEAPESRLAQFEAIGMEPAELQKAADLYRKIKEVMD